MQKIHYSIEIAAPREKVWEVLWEDANFRDWSGVFAEGSHAVSDWKEGSKIQFLESEGNGMSSVIEKLVPNEFMSFKHITEIHKWEEQPPKEWSGALENYMLQEHAGGTKLHVEVEIPDEYRTMFEERFPQALKRIKELAES